jgi:predicted permease
MHREAIMESLLMATKVVVPMAMMVGIGVLFRIFNLADGPTMKKVDGMIFNVFMPMVSFYNIYKTDFSQLGDISYIAYGVAVIMLVFLCSMFVVPRFVKPVPTAASFGQAIYRSNYLIFGAAVAESIYGAGNFGIVTLLGSVAVPVFNAQAAVQLETARHGAADGKKLLLAIAKNPTVIATAAGLAINFTGLVLPELVVDVVQDLAGLTTPLSFLSIGVTLSLGLVARKAYLISAVVLRLVIIPAIFVPLGVLLGFRGQELCALMILFAAPTAVSSYPMAVAMDADGDFAAQMVAYTTVFCLPTIFVFTLILNSLGYM